MAEMVDPDLLLFDDTAGGTIAYPLREKQEQGDGGTLSALDKKPGVGYVPAVGEQACAGNSAGLNYTCKELDHSIRPWGPTGDGLFLGWKVAYLRYVEVADHPERQGGLENPNNAGDMIPKPPGYNGELFTRNGSTLRAGFIVWQSTGGRVNPLNLQGSPDQWTGQPTREEMWDLAMTRGTYGGRRWPLYDQLSVDTPGPGPYQLILRRALGLTAGGDMSEPDGRTPTGIDPQAPNEPGSVTPPKRPTGSPGSSVDSPIFVFNVSKRNGATIAWDVRGQKTYFKNRHDDPKLPPWPQSKEEAAAIVAGVGLSSPIPTPEDPQLPEGPTPLPPEEPAPPKNEQSRTINIDFTEDLVVSIPAGTTRVLFEGTLDLPPTIPGGIKPLIKTALGPRDGERVNAGLFKITRENTWGLEWDPDETRPLGGGKATSGEIIYEWTPGKVSVTIGDRPPRVNETVANQAVAGSVIVFGVDPPKPGSDKPAEYVRLLGGRLRGRVTFTRDAAQPGPIDPPDPPIDPLPLGDLLPLAHEILSDVTTLQGRISALINALENRR